MEAAILIDAINLSALTVVSAISGDRNYIAILLIPLFRVIGTAMPLSLDHPLYSYTLAYLIMLVPIYLIIRSNRFSSQEMGLVLMESAYIPVAIVLGLTLGFFEYQILFPVQMELEHEAHGVLMGLLLMILLVASFVEEFLYRSMLQTVLEKLFGNAKGLLAASIIYGIMFSIYGKLMMILFGICAGFALAFFFQRKRSLLLITLTHGIASISFILIAPLFP